MGNSLNCVAKVYQKFSTTKYLTNFFHTRDKNHRLPSQVASKEASTSTQEVQRYIHRTIFQHINDNLPKRCKSNKHKGFIFLHALPNNHRGFARLFSTLHKQSINGHEQTSKDGTKKLDRQKPVQSIYSHKE